MFAFAMTKSLLQRYGFFFRFGHHRPKKRSLSGLSPDDGRPAAARREADAQLVGAAERMEQIEYNTYLTGKLETSAADQSKTEKANAMIKEMEASLNKLSSDIQALDSKYTNAKARNFIGFSENKVGLASKTGLWISLLCSVLILAAAFICVYLRMFISDKEKKR